MINYVELKTRHTDIAVKRKLNIARGHEVIDTSQNV